jgi:acetyl-CoA carboxylase biotin carboxyl carrier protein
VTEEKFSYAELLQILEVIRSSSQFSEFHLKLGEIEIDLSRGPSKSEIVLTAATAASPAVIAPNPAQHAPAEEPQLTKPAAPAQSWGAEDFVVRSPMVGTFYRAPSPGAPPFVEIGQDVEPDTTICIIEVMKLMSSITAGVRGTITHILPNNAEMVEYDQILMVIEPH